MCLLVTARLNIRLRLLHLAVLNFRLFQLDHLSRGSPVEELENSLKLYRTQPELVLLVVQ